MLQMAELGTNQMRSEEEKAALRLQYEERIRAAEAKLSELRRKLKEKGRMSGSIAQDPALEGAGRTTERLRSELTRLKTQQV